MNHPVTMGTAHSLEGRGQDMVLEMGLCLPCNHTCLLPLKILAHFTFVGSENPGFSTFNQQTWAEEDRPLF